MEARLTALSDEELRAAKLDIERRLARFQRAFNDQYGRSPTDEECKPSRPATKRYRAICREVSSRERQAEQASRETGDAGVAAVAAERQARAAAVREMRPDAFAASVWRLRHRLVAWCFLVAHSSLALDMDVLVGDEGLWPAQHEAIRRAADFDARAQLLYFPSLLSLFGFSLPTLRAVAIVGSVAAASCVLNPGWRAITVAWVSYQSFSIVGGLVLWLPWDCM